MTCNRLISGTRCQNEASKVLTVDSTGDRVALCWFCAEEYDQGVPISYPGRPDPV